jgi:hypothetical protein
MQQGDPVLLFWDVMPAVLVGFERQEGCPCMVEGTRPGLLPEAAQDGNRCNKVTGPASPPATAQGLQLSQRYILDLDVKASSVDYSTSLAAVMD